MKPARPMMTSFMDHVRMTLRIARAACGVSRAEASRATKYTIVHYWNLETGRKRLQFYTTEAMARAAGMSLEQVLLESILRYAAEGAPGKELVTVESLWARLDERAEVARAVRTVRSVCL